MDPPALDALFHQPARFRIMAALLRNRQAAVTWLLRTLNMSDGNLRSHADKLAAAGYIAQGRIMTPEGFQVRYRITPEGEKAFRAYLSALRAFLGELGPDVFGGSPEDGDVNS